MSDDPIARFHAALTEAGKTEDFDPTRAALATASPEGAPSVRFVLVKEQSAEGFVFYTNYNSPKARELEANPRAALAFHWSSTNVQVRVSGPVHRAGGDVSDRYFASRPRGSQLGATVSPQSEIIESREQLEAGVAELAARIGDGPIPRPDDWGGYVLVPQTIEFWIDGNDRLHDRFLYTREADGWTMVRLAP